MVDPGGEAVGGVTVTASGLVQAAITDAEGGFRLAGVPAGEHELLFTLGGYLERQTVTVADGAATRVALTVDWPLAFVEKITVRAVSRRVERIVEAPAAVTTVLLEEIARQSAHGQLPRLVAGAPGAELAQGSLYDFNLNTRGFGGSTNRRVLTLIDGRDPSLPVFSGSQEWAALSFPLEDLESVELVRGPGAALYGAGAFNGVLNLVTRPAATSAGGLARLTLGELATERADLRYAHALEASGGVKVLAAYQKSEDYARSRVEGVEYEPDLLPREIIPPPLDGVDLAALSLRFDHDLGPTRTATLEAGSGRIEGATIVTGLGRLQRSRVDRPWARFNLSAPRWNSLLTYTGRDSDAEVSLSSGGALYLDSFRLGFELQGNADFASGRGRWVGGLSLTRQETDSRDPQGAQTLFAETVDSQHEAVFGQVEYDFTEKLKGVLSLRWDESDLHASKLSPRVALVFGASPRHTLRLTYGDAFLSPSLSEKNVRVPVIAPLDLSPLEQALAPLLGGVPLGLESVPVLAVGSDTLDLEEVRTVEVGYNGILGPAYLTVSYYRSEFENFTSNLVPVLGTSLGPLGNFQRWTPPAELSAEAAQAVLAALAQALPPTFLLARFPDGRPFIPLLSFASFGAVDTQGIELGLEVALAPFRLHLGYSYLDFEIRRAAAENPLSPNRADHQLSAGGSYVGERYDVGLLYRWSNSFDYISGIFAGPVPSYGVVELHLNATLADRWSVGLNVANLLDDEHYEAFGGSLLQRRALAHVTYVW